MSKDRTTIEAIEAHSQKVDRAYDAWVASLALKAPGSPPAHSAPASIYC